ncbi:MAG: hypothetical protein HY421_02795 [Candidatus Kerfeldbacteria bacterium]|nr:hypothetical protein [Candidatus Kerfeldbacteria bacterium]
MRFILSAAVTLRLWAVMTVNCAFAALTCLLGFVPWRSDLGVRLNEKPPPRWTPKVIKGRQPS